MTEAELATRLAEADAAGVDVAAARAELKTVAARRASGAVHLCFFGEISTGKSSLIKALLPDADVAVSPVGGSTLSIQHYRWQQESEAAILLTDVPGTGSTDTHLDTVARDEALRAQVVVFVCDGDLTRRESAALRLLLELDKPLVLAFNKSDRYSADEQAAVLQRLLEHLAELGGQPQRDRVVAVTAGGVEEVIQADAAGAEQVIQRERDADVGVLVVAIQQLLDSGGKALDERRDRAVFRLAADKLESAEARFRAQRSEQIIRSSTRKAVIGAMAAVSPGTDILVQGYLGTSMTRQLSALYGVAPRDLDIEEFLNLSQSQVGRALPLTLAVAGNGLKAFPGVGTVAGGLVHAVAYGLIFDALGRSLVLSLEKRGALEPQAAAQAFEERLGEHVEAGVRRVARLALEQKKSSD